MQAPFVLVSIHCRLCCRRELTDARLITQQSVPQSIESGYQFPSYRVEYAPCQVTEVAISKDIHRVFYLTRVFAGGEVLSKFIKVLFWFHVKHELY